MATETDAAAQAVETAEPIETNELPEPAAPGAGTQDDLQDAAANGAAEATAEAPSAFERASAATVPAARFAGAGPEAHSLATDGVLAALYLRRLGFSADDAAGHIADQSLKAGSTGCKPLLTDLLQRHQLRVPFENLGEQRGTLDPRSCAERIASSTGGGTSIVINVAFAWLLRQLGSTPRLVLAHAAAPGHAAPHVVVVVELSEGAHIADPGFSDPPRVSVPLEGESTDDLASYLVASSDGSGAPAGFDAVLKRSRGASSLSRHAWDPDDNTLDSQEADMTVMYAFRRKDDLGAEELQSALEASRTQSGRLYAEQRLVCFALPKGHISLSERQYRKVEGGSVVAEESVSDEAAWEKKVSEVMASPLTRKCGSMGRPLPPKSAGGKFKPVVERKNSFNAPNRSAVNGPLRGVQASRQAAESATAGLGLVDGKSLAVGGAGAGGGLGLNAPGFGTKVQHFAGGGGGKSINVGTELYEAWQKVMDDADPLGWVYCEYASDGRTLSLTDSGSGGLREFKEKLGDILAWGGFRCAAVDRRGGVECKRAKFVFVQYKPEAASMIKKAKAASHKGDVKEALCGAHIDVTVESLKDLDEQVLITKLQAATGAHKPNGYEFEEGVFLEADFYGLGIGKDCKGETSKN